MFFALSQSASSIVSFSVEPGCPRDEVRYEVLLLARLLAGLAERLREALVVLDRRLLHLVEHLRVGVLGGDAELAAGVVARQIADELGASRGQVVANPAGDVDALDPGLCANAAQRSTSGAWSVTRFSQMPGVHAREAPACVLGLVVLAPHLVHVRGGAADVGDRAAELLHA